MEDTFINDHSACCPTDTFVILSEEEEEQQQQHRRRVMSTTLGADSTFLLTPVVDLDYHHPTNSNNELRTDDDLAFEIQGLELLLENLGGSDSDDEGDSYANDSLDMQYMEKRGLRRNPREERESRLQARYTNNNNDNKTFPSYSTTSLEDVLKPLELPVKFCPLPMMVASSSSNYNTSDEADESRRMLRRYSNCAA
jgi:hypothetical protein